MDLLSVVDAGIIGAIIAIMEVFKAIDKEKKLVRWYPLCVLVFAILAALFKTTPFAWQAFGYNALLYVGVSSFTYKFGKTTVLGK